MRTLVDAFAIPEAWLACAILEEEGDRQEAMYLEDRAARDAELRAGAAEGSQAPADTATDLEVAPAQ
jgi:acyl-CoA oxidase